MPNWKKIITSGSDAVLNSLNIVNSLTASGLTYPSSDNGEFSFLQSDGNGNLTLQYVETVHENVYNDTLTQILKGTPLYVSGSEGANPKVFPADAGDPNKMPVIYIAAENIEPASEGRGILLGLITGVNTTGYSPGTEIYVDIGGGWTSTRPTGSAIIQLLGIVTKEGNGGQGVVLNPGPATLPNLTEGYTWVGDSNSYPSEISIDSFRTGSFTGSFVGDGSGLINLPSTQGTQGTQGIQGATGTTGNQGTQGIQGAIGNQGTQGIQGIQGAIGATGNQGTQGTQGIQGAIGATGNQGTQGTIGITGDQGTTGLQGIQGTQGTTGAQGSQGTTGSQGTQGIQGIQGLTGAGTQGTQGMQGTQGTQGIKGEDGIIGVDGAQGTQGTQGSQGTQGLTGLQGIQGIQGSQGTQGTQGLTGLQGIQGSQGSQGTQGTQGTQGVQGQSIQGIQGIQGADGGGSSGVTVEAKNSGYTILTTDNSKVFTCNSTSTQTFNLPSVASGDIGLTYTIVKLGTGQVTIDAADSDTIEDSGAGDTIYCNDETPATITLRLLTNTGWYIVSANGTWITTD
jgi:hypothetical protein